MYDAEPAPPARALHQDDLRAATRRKNILSFAYFHLFAYLHIFIFFEYFLHIFIFFCESLHGCKHCRGEADKELNAAGLLRPSKPLPAWLHCPGLFSVFKTFSVSSSSSISQSYSQDGCIEDFENNSEFSQKYQVCSFSPGS